MSGPTSGGREARSRSSSARPRAGAGPGGRGCAPPRHRDGATWARTGGWPPLAPPPHHGVRGLVALRSMPDHIDQAGPLEHRRPCLGMEGPARGEVGDGHRAGIGPGLRVHREHGHRCPRRRLAHRQLGQELGSRARRVGRCPRSGPGRPALRLPPRPAARTPRPGPCPDSRHRPTPVRASGRSREPGTRRRSGPEGGSHPPTRRGPQGLRCPGPGTTVGVGRPRGRSGDRGRGGPCPGTARLTTSCLVRADRPAPPGSAVRPTPR